MRYLYASPVKVANEIALAMAPSIPTPSTNTKRASITVIAVITKDPVFNPFHMMYTSKTPNAKRPIITKAKVTK